LARYPTHRGGDAAPIPAQGVAAILRRWRGARQAIPRSWTALLLDCT
jgi:hypothetical protein